MTNNKSDFYKDYTKTTETNGISRQVDVFVTPLSEKVAQAEKITTILEYMWGEVYSILKTATQPKQGNYKIDKKTMEWVERWNKSYEEIKAG